MVDKGRGPRFRRFREQLVKVKVDTWHEVVDTEGTII